MGKESRMRNDVKLGLAVGGLLLGVVLAYALFFSNTNKNGKELAEGSYSTLENNGAAVQRSPAPSNADQAPTDSNPPANTGGAAAAPEHPSNALTDAAPANPLIGKSWQLLLNE